MYDPLTIGRLISNARETLSKANVSTPELDARLLLQGLMQSSHAEMIGRRDEIVSSETVSMFNQYVSRRVAGEPVHRILANREFYGRSFSLSDATLIPRPDTEVLVETVLQLVRAKKQPLNILELGTGSGAIAVTLASELPNVSLVATDISDDALTTARRNAAVNNVQDRIEFLKSDMFSEVSGQFDVLVSNPPYIPTDDVAALEIEVREHDPKIALDGGFDGLDFYREIFSSAHRVLKNEALIFVEFGLGQAEAISSIAVSHDWRVEKIEKDLPGIDRVAVAQRVS